jgi:hypothetical protein
MALETKIQMEKKDGFRKTRKLLRASPLDNVDVKSVDPDLIKKL